GISEAYVWLVSQIGRPIDQPMIASAELILEKNTSLKEVSREVRDIIDARLENIDEFCMELIEGRIPVC
ncbi:MAG: methionine adenosyltransferase, partial [Candidatus Bathyarchaeia archaeon]